MLPRLCHVGDADEVAIHRAAKLGFNGVIVMASNARGTTERQHAVAQSCASSELNLFLDIDFSEWDLHHPLVERHPDCFAIRREPDGAIVDPRLPLRGRGRAYLRNCDDLTPVVEWVESQVGEAIAAGAKGFRALHPNGVSAEIWAHVMGGARQHSNRELIFVADTTGLARSRLSALQLCGFDFTLSSLPWWDGRANWFIEEHQALSRIAPVIAQVDLPAKMPPASLTARRARLVLAALTGSGFMMPLRFADEAMDEGETAELDVFVRSVNKFVAAEQQTSKLLLKPTGARRKSYCPDAMEGADPSLAGEAYVALVNPSPARAAGPGTEMALALGDFDALQAVFERRSPASKVPPGAALLFHAARSPAIRQGSGLETGGVTAAANAARIVITNVAPCIEGGRFPARRIVGERLSVEADIFTDGHPLIAADLCWRAEDERMWRRMRMIARDNDRWGAAFEMPRIGRYRFAISAWIDAFGGFVRDLLRKRDAGENLELEAAEGLAHLKTYRARASGAVLSALNKLIDVFGERSLNDRIALLVAPETRETVARVDDKRFLVKSGSYFVDAERKASPVCELVRTVSAFADRKRGAVRHVARCHRDACPPSRDMGFDVLYLTPIHPIGRTTRKGRNNALQAAARRSGQPLCHRLSRGRP